MGVRLKYREGTLTAFLSGEIDDHGAKTLREEIDATAEKVRPVRLRGYFWYVLRRAAELPFVWLTREKYSRRSLDTIERERER